MSVLKERVEARLAALHLTPYEAATKAGLDRGYVADIVRGKKHKLTTDYAAKLAAVLECDLAWLADGKGQPPADVTVSAPEPAQTLGARVRHHREALGWKQAELGRRLGVTRNAVSLWEADKTEPSPTTLLKLASVLKVPVRALTEPPADEPASQELAGFGPPLPADARGEVRRAEVELPPLAAMPRDVPVYGTAAGSLVGAFQFEGVVEYVRRPPALMGVPVAYALYVTGSSMSPEHNPGDLRFIHPGRPPRVGDTVIVQTRNHEADGIASYIKTLVRMNDQRLVLQQRNPEATMEIDRRTVVAVHRVLTVNELFGV